MEKYETIELEIIEFGEEDIIVASPDTEGRPLSMKEEEEEE